MTCGIYVIRFHNTDKVYIGQSKNIEVRFTQHLSKLRLQKASPKLQEGFNTFGIKEVEVLVECSIEELDKYEKEAIEIFDSVKNGFNTLEDPSSAPIYAGEEHPAASESNNTYIRVLELLVQKNPSLNKRQISDLTGVSIYVIRHIAALESHLWLKEARPLEYAMLEEIKENSKYYYGTEYPKLKAPDGSIHTVTHITNFAKEHNLLQPKITELFRGTRKIHKGWVLA